MSENNKSQLFAVAVKTSELSLSGSNPRKIESEGFQRLCSGMKDDPEFLEARPIIASNRTGKLVVVAGNQRLRAAQSLGMETVPVIIVNLSEEKEKLWSLKDNLHQGDWDWDALAEFDEMLLTDAGFNSEELDKIFEDDPTEEQWSLEAELDKLNIETITVQKGDVYDLDGSRLCCGDSTVEADVFRLMGDEKADLVMMDPPYRLDYLQGKTRHGDATVGFGTKKNRRYLETESLPEDFTDLWMSNVVKVQAKDFAIICYESWKNIREIWDEMEKRWKVKNMIVWNLPNRNQGYAGRYKLFSKYDIAMVGTSEDHPDLNLEDEDELLQNEYQTALFAISGKPHWESYGKGKKYCPTDHITFNAADEKSSGQAIVFGVKPTEILIPYIKILTTRGQLIYEPFGGSGSSLISSIMLGRRCYVMEKSPTYCEVILNRWEKHTGKKRRKINGEGS